MLQRKDKRGRLVCICGSYHFPHRKGGGACVHSSKADYYLAIRQGVSEIDAMELLTVADLRKLYPIEGDK